MPRSFLRSALKPLIAVIIVLLAVSPKHQQRLLLTRGRILKAQRIYDLTPKGKSKRITAMTIKTYPMRLVESHSISPKVKHFSFSTEAFTQFIPGQFITIHFYVEGKALKRSYSVANHDTGQGIEFAASYVPNGPASELLFNLRPGEELQASGPFGRLILKDEPVQRYFLIATSTGITPYRAMLNQLSELLKADNTLEVHILQGVQRPEDLLYREEFLSWAHTYPNAFFHACYSKEIDATEPFAYQGYVQTKLLALSPRPEGDVFYLCGNPYMVDACFSLLKEKAVPVSNIRREKYISR